MPFINWTDRYSVGVKELDDQHRQLIAMINELHDAMLTKQGKEAVMGVLNKLAGYCIGHFATEEKLMSSHGYPEFTEHRDKHLKMTGKVKALIREVQAGKATVTIEVMNFLMSWLDQHIMGTDKKYGPFLNSKDVA